MNFLEELYTWIEPTQKEFLLNYVSKKQLLNLLLKSGLQLSDLQHIVTNRSCSKETFCPPTTVYLMGSPTKVEWWDSEVKLTRTRITYHFTVPVYNTQVQLMVLRYLGLYIPVYCYESAAITNLYGRFGDVNVNIGMKPAFDKDLKSITKCMQASISNSVRFQPVKKWRDDNNVLETTEEEQWRKIKTSIEWEQLNKWCNG